MVYRICITNEEAWYSLYNIRVYNEVHIIKQKIIYMELLRTLKF